MPYKNVRVREVTFVFKYDDVDPTILHIYARHLMEPVDAINVFFNGKTEYNADQERYETSTDTHTLYWFWHDKSTSVNRIVVIISCFRK